MKLVSTYKIILNEYISRKLILEAQEELNLSPTTKHNLEEIGRAFGSGYVKWMIHKIQTKNLREEDVYKYPDFFKYFQQGKSLGYFTHTDIFKYKDSQEFEREAIASHEKIIGFTGEIKDQNSKYLASPQQIKTLNNVGILFLGLTPDGYQVFKIPQSLKGNNEAFELQKNILGRCQGREMGARISICTLGNIRHFNDYLSTDDLYIFFNMGDPKSPYQFHYSSNSFMNKDDKSL